MQLIEDLGFLCNFLLFLTINSEFKALYQFIGRARFNEQRIWRFLPWLNDCSNENQDYCFIPNICHEILYMPKGMRKVSVTNSKKF